MTKIQLGSGASSSTTHHLTQSSQTIDRRSVIRPSNLAIEEAARSTNRTTEPSAGRPSRLVNLRVHAADLIQAQAEPEAQPSQPTLTPESTPIVPHVVELGTINREQAQDLPPVDLSCMVPEEAPVEEPVNYTPAIINTPATPSTPIPTTSEIVVASQSAISSLPETSSQDLAMSIAADYAAANLGAVEATDSSIDVIAQATSEAIAAIRTATDPEEIAEQVASLQTFANNIKASSAAPEMVELSNTIEKFIEVAMKSTRVQEEVQKKITQKTVEEKPIVKKTAPKAITAKKPSPRSTTPKVSTRQVTRPASKPAARRIMRPATKSAPHLVADEDRALRTALRNVAAMDDEPEAKTTKAPARRKRGAGKRLVLAFFCAVACVAAVVYFIGSNIPDISVKVAALQTGIEASYPSYIPRDYSLSDISSENGRITMSFKGPEKANFVLTEEKSSWDSTALLRNYVEPTWQSNYITTHEQGITIYISGANAAWVNGGVLYKITAPSNSLTKKQLRNIVTSM